MWYSRFLKTALRKHNLRVDLRVYPGDEIDPTPSQDVEAKLKSILSSAIIKGLDIIGIVSRFSIEPGYFAKNMAETNKIDIKVIPGQDYVSSDGIRAVFYLIQKNIQGGLPIQHAMKQCRSQGGKIMLYDLTHKQVGIVNGWGELGPDCVEVYNANTQGYKDLDIEYPRVICSAARSGSELEKVSNYSDIPRKQMEDWGMIGPDEGIDYEPDYLRRIV